MGFSLRLSAVQRLVLARFCIFIWSAGVVALTVDEPWLGVTLATDDDRVQVADRDASGPAAAIEPGAALISIAPVSGSGEAIRLVPLDLVEEPDTLESYAAFNDFIARQSALHAILESGEATLSVTPANRTTSQFGVPPAPARPRGSLPGTLG